MRERRNRRKEVDRMDPWVSVLSFELLLLIEYSLRSFFTSMNSDQVVIKTPAIVAGKTLFLIFVKFAQKLELEWMTWSPVTRLVTNVPQLQWRRRWCWHTVVEWEWLLRWHLVDTVEHPMEPLLLPINSSTLLRVDSCREIIGFPLSLTPTSRLPPHPYHWLRPFSRLTSIWFPLYMSTLLLSQCTLCHLSIIDWFHPHEVPFPIHPVDAVSLPFSVPIPSLSLALHIQHYFSCIPFVSSLFLNRFFSDWVGRLWINRLF